MAELLWVSRSRLPFFNFPIPCRLPYGGWFLAYGDDTGAKIFWSALSHYPIEEGYWKFFSRALTSGMTFFDIGANQGFYTILASKRVGPQGRVFAFEPAGSELQKLRRNLLLNRCRNVSVQPQAVCQFEGFTEFYLCLGHQGAFSSICHPARDVTARKKLIQVAAITLDAFIQRLSITSVDFIKIDVEGGELEVLKGGHSVLEKLRPIVMCEISDMRTEPWAYQAGEILGFLRRYGYLLYSAEPNGILQPYRSKAYYDWENVIAIPKEKVHTYT